MAGTPARVASPNQVGSFPLFHGEDSDAPKVVASADMRSDLEPIARQHCLTPHQEQQGDLENDLKSYLELLPHFHSSINAMLDAEYNSSPQQALNLVQYYQEREGLLDYTLETELPRMDYTIQLDGNTVLHNTTPGETISMADSLRRHLCNTNETIAAECHQVLLRAANQSLLADCLQVLTGPDRVIRPQFMATAVATSCHFLVDLAGKSDNRDRDEPHAAYGAPSVKATAELSIHLPTPSGRWKVADMTVVAQCVLPLDPWQPPTIHYRLASVRPITNEETPWQGNIKSTVSYIAQLETMAAMLPPCSGKESDVCTAPPGNGLKRQASLPQDTWIFGATSSQPVPAQESKRTTSRSSWFWRRSSSSSSLSIDSLRSLRASVAALSA